MSAELSERQQAVLAALKITEKPRTAGAVAANMEGHPDSRGVAQTLRRLKDDGKVVRNLDGTYRAR